MIGQFRCFPHVVDRLPDIPVWRDGDELRLHPPAGKIFRIVEAARERDALGLRQLLEDLSLFILRQVFQDGDRVVGLQFTHALGDRLRRQLSRISSRTLSSTSVRAVKSKSMPSNSTSRCLWSAGKASISAPMSDSCRLPTSAFNSVHVGHLDPARDALDEGLADRAILVARKLRGGLDVVHLFLIEHVEGLSAEN